MDADSTKGEKWMDRSISSFESELHISLKPVLAALMALGLALIFLSDSQLDPSEWVPITIFALLLFAMSAIAWTLESWKPWVSRSLTIVTLLAGVHVMSLWLDMPGSLALAAIPTALAALLSGFPATLVTAVGESLFLAILLNCPAAGLDVSAVIVALIATWAAVGIVYALYRPIYQLSGWLEEYFERARRLLEEARDREAELKQALESVARVNRQLALANERIAALRAIAEEAQRAKTAFVANVSHEFRTPLNMIIGLVDLMVETPEIYSVVLSPEMREDLKVVHRNCEYLSNMIDDVLNLTRMEAGHLTLHRERVDLMNVIDSSVTAVRPLLEKKHLALKVTVPDDLPQVYCDRTRIQQVVLNLVSNAARFTEEGEITVDVVRQNQHVLVNVADTGPGISSEDAERIFEPFYQGMAQLWRDKGGSGLGLSISRQFIKLHGGQMWLESKLGVGTSFFFTLPISSPMEHGARPGHQIKGDWVWRERAFRTDQTDCADHLLKPRIVICDETGALYPRFVRYSDQAEFVDVQGLAQAMQELHQCAAHVVLLNAETSESLWPLLEIARQEAPDTLIVGCSVPRWPEQAAYADVLGYLIKPVTRTDLEAAIRAVGRPVRRVLVVDDDPDVLRLFGLMLRACDDSLEIATASCGEQVLGVLRHTPPDLMLLDVVMPDMDGWQVLDSMRHDAEIGGAPTYLVSAQDPADQPPASKFLLITVGEGISLSKLLRCSLEMSSLLLRPEGELDLVPG
jgi:signal transduction histidine kinase/CheY-like chemotaxis protein